VFVIRESEHLVVLDPSDKEASSPPTQLLVPFQISPAAKHELDNRKTQVILASVCVGLIVIDIVAAFVFPWWRARMSADFWPIDSSRIAPKIVGTFVQAVIGVIFIAVFWPPLRRRIASLLEESSHQANRELHHKLAEAHERIDSMLRHHVELHEKLDHIIRHHPDIPEFVDKAEQTAPNRPT
jgi:hypothetical protein